MTTKQPLVFAHIGDLHITKARERNYIDFLSIVAQIETECNGKLDFVILPGDNADHGECEQYNLVATALKMLGIPVYLLAGDHDMEQGSLNGFYSMPAAEHLPKAVHIKEVRCLFLDVCGPGKGGPDFRLGNQQLLWLENELVQSKAANEEAVIFMHTYPDDLADKNETIALNKLIKENNVVLVDMGHTHYNEITNDGNTIYSATRSTGQIEEGPVGYSLISVCNKVVSWRFKLLDEPFPFVMITFPGDYHLATKQTQPTENIDEIRAVVMSAREITSVHCKIDESNWMPMKLAEDNTTWFVSTQIKNEKETTVTVKAVDETGRPGMHTIIYSPEKINEIKNLKQGSDEYTIGAWAENHVFGTQLGPNRNANKLK